MSTNTRRYEYLQVEIAAADRPSQWTITHGGQSYAWVSFLNRRGEEGWDLVTVIPADQYYAAIFRKDISPVERPS